jgi:eukaryotic-like serine/threonine-protein kinase
MAISSSGLLMDALRQHSLLSAAQLAQLPNMTKGRCANARGFCKLLLQRGWLSVYQVNQLLAGKGHELTIGPYYVVDKLGQGGLSSVFKGRHREHGNLVAIKIIKPEVFASPEGRQQFLQEVEAMARLDHPNIVQFCDADQFKDTFYFAMEYVDGTDMGKVVRLSGALPVHEACDYIRQAALGLQHAFERNLIHRDIKPVNLFLTHVPEEAPKQSVFATRQDLAREMNQGKATVRMKPLIKILDWGLASLRNPKGVVCDDDIATSVVGTADFLSPEQARNANTVDIRGDIYSLGCSLYFLLTGQAPFPNGTLMQKILQHQQNDPMPLDVFREDLPAGLTTILSRMMAKQPDDRFQTPASAAMALQPFTKRMPTPASNVSLPTTSKSPLPGPSADTPLPAALRSDEFLRVPPGK